MKAVNIGSELPQALVADSAPVPSIQSVEDFQVKTDPSSHFDAKLRDADIIRDLNAVRKKLAAMQFFSRQATNAIIATEQVRKLTAGYKADAEYPQGFGQQLRLIAQIIAANFGTRLFYCQVGGFDTHANQVNGHENCCSKSPAAIAAFHKDIAAKGYGQKVTLMCFSEFGRRVTQNDSNGTDHGAAGPMFISGDGVKGGLYGAVSFADGSGRRRPEIHDGFPARVCDGTSKMVERGCDDGAEREIRTVGVFVNVVESLLPP